MPLGIRTIAKKTGAWIIRPSIFNYGRNASNPLGDAIDLLKRDDNPMEAVDVDLEDQGPIAQKHKAIVATVKSIPEGKRVAKAREHIAYSVLSLSMAILAVVSAVYLLFMDLKADIPFVYVIVTKMPWAILIMLGIAMLTLLVYVLSHMWRYKLLTSPDTSVPFTDFISTPKLWF
ncbi:hypothetical protein [Shewanella marisflavi]|uniref:hypothetical protein n=1 Tax=Shewanella marisflavi TaxID=260364 RepID=UPI003AAD349B